MSAALTGVIPAAGRGTRAYPHTRTVPKAMLDVCGKPVLHYTIETMRDKLGIRDIVVVIGAHGDAIRDEFGSGEAYGVRLQYVLNERPEHGLAWSVLLSRPRVTTPHFALMLSDELYVNSNHAALLQSGYHDHDVTLAVRGDSMNKEIRKNFSIEMRDGRIASLVEKPKVAHNGLLGCGTYLFGSAFYETLQKRFDRGAPDAGDLTGAINDHIAAGGTAQAFALSGGYVNINYPEDVNAARSIVRRERLRTAKVSVVSPCLSPAPLIEDMLLQSRGLGRVSEFVLVAREETPEFAALARKYGARLVVVPGTEPQFADYLRCGVEQTRGDIIVMTMDDESFDLADVDKLLAYITEADLVVGTRTTGNLIQQGSNVNWIARTGNYMLAKLIQWLWIGSGVSISDVGCTLRAMWRETYDQAAPDLRCRGPAYLAEMVIEALRRRLWIVEIPINYCRATEESRVRIENRTVGVFVSIAAMILSRRFRRAVSASSRDVRTAADRPPRDERSAQSPAV